MATSFVFNPFTSNFDQISTITLAAVGSTPNANGATLTGQVLNLQPADSTNPGVVTATGDQFFGGNKYISYIQSGGTTLTQARIGSTANMVAVGTFLSSVSYIGSSPTICGYKANGTEAVPTATIGNQILFAMSGRGHDGTSFVLATKGRFSINSAENWTPTAQGTYLQFLTTPKLGTTVFERMRIHDDGNVSIGNTTSTAKLSVTGNITASTTIIATGNMSAANLSGTNTGDVTLGAVGSTPNANAASLTGQALTLQPADASFPGVVTTGTQSFAGAKTFTGAITASNLSGTNTGDQTITLTGDVTGSGTGSFAATIAADAVDNSKLADMATLTIKGNNTGGAANPLDLTVSQVNTMLGTVVNPMTTQGDIIFGGASGLPTRLGQGTANQVLQIQGSGNAPSWQGIYQNNYPNYIAANPNFEVDTTGWATYADAAGPVPVNGTGGSPTATFTRSTSSPLRGTASGLLTKGASNLQGEGVSYDFTIDAADINKVLAIQVDLSGSAAFVAGAASDVTIWIYDITNSTIIQPAPYTINQATQTFIGSFQATSSQSYRLIFHISTTNAAAWTLKLDNVVVSAAETVYAANIGEWNSNLTFTLDNIVASSSTFKTRIVGDSLEVIGYIAISSTSGSAFAINLPSGYLIDNTKIPTGSTMYAGNMARLAAVSFAGTSSGPFIMFADGSTTNKIYVAQDATTSVFNKTTGSSLSSGSLAFHFIVPIAGLSANTAVANGRVFNISSIIANGTNVTAQPAALGEYRTYIKNSLAVTGVDNAPSTAPSVNNGMLIYGVNYATAGTSGQTNRWEIFVGKYKYVTPSYFASAGRTGYLNADYYDAGANTRVGLIYSYNPATGVACVDAIEQGASTATRAVGTAEATAGGASTYPANGYFDLVVSENALAVSYDYPRSEVLLTGGNGFGSTNINTRRYTTLYSQTGSSLTVTQSASAGDSITVNKTGVYCITNVDYDTVTKGYLITTRNATSTSATHPNRLVAAYNDTLTPASTCVTVNLSQGDIIRSLLTATGNPATSADLVYLRVTQVSN